MRACSVSSQSMWIEWDWMGLNPKQVKLLLIFFSIPSNTYVLGITEQALRYGSVPGKEIKPRAGKGGISGFPGRVQRVRV
jgi:hypothetical protein